MKIQFLISSSSWAVKYKKIIINKIKKLSNNLVITYHHKNLKNNYDINIIFSYFKIIPKKYLSKSKVNLVPHESNLPQGKGMSPLSWQILNNKKEIFFSLIEASSKLDGGVVYYKKKVTIPKTYLFDDIKKIQFDENLKLIIKFIKFYKKFNKTPKFTIQKGKSTYYKKRTPKDSELSIKKTLLKQFNLLRINDNENYPSFFKIYRKKFFIKIYKE